MAKPARFTQSEVAKLLRAARGTRFHSVTIEVLAAGGLRATYSANPALSTEPNEWDVVFNEKPSAVKTGPAKLAAREAMLSDALDVAEALKKKRPMPKRKLPPG